MPIRALPCLLTVALLQTAPASEACPFGIAMCNQRTYTLAEYAPAMAAAGARWVRGFPTANVLEPERGRFDWSACDTLLDSAEANGLSVSGLLYYTPSWLPASEAKLPAGDLEGWKGYVSALVSHCKGRVRYWEVWNETPNFIGTSTAEDYARTGVASYEAAKAADPDCRIGLSIQSNNVAWIAQCLRAGAAGHYDFLAVHPYESLGLVESDGLEPVFLATVPSLRAMLAELDPDKRDLPVWFTELGYDARDGEPAQASALVKGFTLALAQGVERVNWFEGMDGDSGPMGLIRADGTPRMALAAMRRLTEALGPTPEYLGWIRSGKATAFVFEGAGGPVAVSWGSADEPGDSDGILGMEAEDLATGARETGRIFHGRRAPQLIRGLPSGMPADLLAAARAHRDRPLPFSGEADYRGATSVYARMGSPNEEAGLHHVSADATSDAAIAWGVPARDCSKGSAQTFAVDPAFLTWDGGPIVISAVVRGSKAGDPAGFNLVYESESGLRNTGSWTSVPGNEQWHTVTWRLDDARFVGKWGYHFSLNSDAPMPYYLRSVTVTKLAR